MLFLEIGALRRMHFLIKHDATTLHHLKHKKHSENVKLGMWDLQIRQRWCSSFWPVRALSGESIPVGSIHAQSTMETRPTGTLVRIELTAVAQESGGTVTEVGPHNVLTSGTIEAGLGPALINFQFTVYTFFQKLAQEKKKGKVLAKC